MEINRLLNDELTYELHVRNAPTDGTVDVKRSRLRDVLKCERLANVSLESPVVLDSDNEISICGSKLNDLTNIADYKPG
ncbi:hypothetical protein FQR65_LT13460 [Abscondita terminalis]|nr:hypothetical protein FQR65_LT13460 [Abscondita terminalis]